MALRISFTYRLKNSVDKSNRVTTLNFGIETPADALREAEAFCERHGFVFCSVLSIEKRS